MLLFIISQVVPDSHECQDQIFSTRATLLTLTVLGFSFWADWVIFFIFVYYYMNIIIMHNDEKQRLYLMIQGK